MANIHLSYSEWAELTGDSGLTNWVKYNWIGAGEEHGWVIMCKSGTSKINMRGFATKVLGLTTAQSSNFVDKWYVTPLAEDTRMFTYANPDDFDDVILGVYETQAEAETEYNKLTEAARKYYYVAEI